MNNKQQNYEKNGNSFVVLETGRRFYIILLICLNFKNFMFQKFALDSSGVIKIFYRFF